MSTLDVVEITVEAPIQVVEVQVPGAQGPTGPQGPAAPVTYTTTLTPILHRGGSSLAPENTMQAFTAAVALGATHLESDIQMTADGVPVLIHDDRVERTTQGTGYVRDYTLERLQLLSAASPLASLIPSLSDAAEYSSGIPTFDSQFGYDTSLNPLCRIPTFYQAVSWAVGRVDKFFLEIKTTYSWTQDEVTALCATVEDLGAEDMVVFQSFDFTHLAWVREANTRVGVLMTAPTTSTEIDLDLEAVQALGGTKYILCSPAQIIAAPEIIEQARSLGIEVAAATISATGGESVKQLLDLGVGLQMTDIWIAGGR